MTLEQQVADLTTQTTALLNAVNVQKSFLDTAVTRSNESIEQATAAGAAQVELAAIEARASAANAATVSGANATAQQALAGTTSAAAQAANARDQSIAAWRAAAAPAEQLAAMSQSIHSGAIIDAYLYDTSKDSDGGAWRKRCQNTSWYNESINGRWLGQKAGELEARGDNLLTYPEDLTNSIWGKSTVIVTPNAAIAPDGTMSADKMVEDTSNGYHAAYNQSYIVGLGEMYTLSVYAKAAEHPRLRVAPSTTSSWSLQPSAVFDLVNGAVLIGTGIITSVGNGWYLCQTSGVIAVGNSFRGISLGPVAAGTLSNMRQGDGISGIYIWGAKINKVGELPSTYISSPELMAGGSFEVIPPNTVLVNGATASIVNNALRVENGVANYGRAEISVPTEIGKAYTINLNRIGGTGNGSWNLGTQANRTQYGSLLPTTFTFLATATTAVISLTVGGNTQGAYFDYDNVSVKEVTVFATPYVPCSQISGYYQNTTDGKFYALTQGAYGQTETFRGNVREFPAIAGAVVSSGALVLYDLTQSNCPMWMVFIASSANASRGALTALVLLNGQLHITGAGGGNGYIRVNFIADKSNMWNDVGRNIYGGNLAARNAGMSFKTIASGGINGVVNDLAVTVLPNAPIDAATGLPVPTVAVATVNGAYVVRQDGTVVKSLSTNNIRSVDITSRGSMVVSNAAGLQGYSRYAPLQDISDSFALTSNPLSAPGPSGNDQRYVTAMNTTYAEYLSKSSGGIALGDQRLQVHRLNPFASNLGMVAHMTHAYNTGWMVGDIRGAWLADTVTEMANGSVNLVANGTFDTDLANWTVTGSAVVSDGKASLTRNAAGGSSIVIPISCEIGKAYTVTTNVSGPNLGRVDVTNTSTLSGALVNLYNIPNGQFSATFTATQATHYLGLLNSTGGEGMNVQFDNVAVRRVEFDRSVKNKPLNIIGSIAKAPVAAGAQLVGYSGFSATNYFEQPHSTDLEFGTGDFCAIGWMKPAVVPVNLECAISLGDDSVAPTGFDIVYVGATDFRMRVNIASGAQINTATPIVPIPDAWNLVAMVRSAGVVHRYINGVLADSTPCPVDISHAASQIWIGIRKRGAGVNGPFRGSLALWRVGATAPSADQIAQIYRDELALFQPNSKCTIDGDTSSVTAMAYDDSTDVLHVGTNWGRSEFKGLTRIASSSTVSGAITCLAAGGGAHITGGATSTRYVQPTISLREELKRKEDARRAMTREETPFDFDGIAAQTEFTLPYGYSVKGAFIAGTKKRVGPTKDYTISYDGYRETVKFGVSPGITWVQINANRSI